MHNLEWGVIEEFLMKSLGFEIKLLSKSMERI